MHTGSFCQSSSTPLSHSSFEAKYFNAGGQNFPVCTACLILCQTSLRVFLPCTHLQAFVFTPCVISGASQHPHPASSCASEALQQLLVHRDHQNWCQFDVDLNKARPTRLDRELLAWISKFWLLVWFLLQALFQIQRLRKRYLIFLARSCVQGNSVWSSLGTLFICNNGRSPTYSCMCFESEYHL